jgi:hypothetical protein
MVTVVNQNTKAHFTMYIQSEDPMLEEVLAASTTEDLQRVVGFDSDPIFR